MQYAVLVVGFGDIVCPFQYDGLCICHSDAQSCAFNHCQVVVAISTADHFIGCQSDTVQQTLQGSFFFVKVKDESHLALDADAYRNDVSLKGEFIRQVLASELTDADKAAVIRAGLQALSGEEISL